MIVLQELLRLLNLKTITSDIKAKYIKFYTKVEHKNTYG